MKFGVQATQSGVTWGELLGLWQELDRDSNFDHLWLMDHFVTGAGTAGGSSRPPTEGWARGVPSSGARARAERPGPAPPRGTRPRTPRGPRSRPPRRSSSAAAVR